MKNPELAIAKRQISSDWFIDCIVFHGKVLFGEKAHWCFDWDMLPIDETCFEFKYCTCFDNEL